MIAELAESEPEYSLLSLIIILNFQESCANMFSFRKEENSCLGVPSLESYLVSG